MQLLVMKYEDFEREAHGIKASDIGFSEATILGQRVIVGSPEIENGGKHELALAVSRLKDRIMTIDHLGDGIAYVTSEGQVWRKADIVKDVERLELSPELEYSELCSQLLALVMFTAERLDL